MVSYKIKQFPNLITLLRIGLTFFLNIYILKNPGNLAIPLIIFIFLLLTDFLDGKVARHYGVSTKFGAIFDLLADLLFILSSTTLLIYLQVIPKWFLGVILIKFTEFIFTSFILKEDDNEEVFVFDYFGRLTAGLFYVIPILSYTLVRLNHSFYLSMIQILLYFTSFLATVSFVYRISRCIKYRVPCKRL